MAGAPTRRAQPPRQQTDSSSSSRAPPNRTGTATSHRTLPPAPSRGPHPPFPIRPPVFFGFFEGGCGRLVGLAGFFGGFRASRVVGSCGCWWLQSVVSPASSQAPRWAAALASLGCPLVVCSDPVVCVLCLSPTGIANALPFAALRRTKFRTLPMSTRVTQLCVSFVYALTGSCHSHLPARPFGGSMRPGMRVLPWLPSVPWPAPCKGCTPVTACCRLPTGAWLG